MTRKFKEMALCHLPDDEIYWVQHMIREGGLTSAYKNDAGFFIWTEVRFTSGTCPVLLSLLSEAKTDYVLFDCDVEPDPELEIYP